MFTVAATANAFCTRTLALDYSSSSVVVFFSSVFGKDYLADPFRQRWCLLVRIWILALLCFQRKLMLFCFFFSSTFSLNALEGWQQRERGKGWFLFSTLVEAGLSVLSICVCLWARLLCVGGKTVLRNRNIVLSPSQWDERNPTN